MKLVSIRFNCIHTSFAMRIQYYINTCIPVHFIGLSYDNAKKGESYFNVAVFVALCYEHFLRNSSQKQDIKKGRYRKRLWKGSILIIKRSYYLTTQDVSRAIKYKELISRMTDNHSHISLCTHSRISRILPIFRNMYRISLNRGLSRIEAGLVYRPGVFRLNLAIVARCQIKAGLSTHAPSVPCHALYATYSSIVEART